MLVTLKTLQDDIFTVEIDPSQTVKNFKEKIEKVKGDEFPAKNMKLMYAGKFLVDNNRVSDYNVEEKKFVIVVIKKPKVTVVKEEEPESSTEMPRERNPLMNGRIRVQQAHMCSEHHEALVRHIIELGFTRAEVEAALCASYNNPDRAVEYLINGVLPSSSNDDAETEARQRDPDHVSDSSDAHLLRHISMSGPPSPGSSTMPNQERIMQLFTEAMDDSQNQTRAADSLLEEDHDLITQSFAEMEAADMYRRSSGAASASSSMPPPDGLPDSSVFASADTMFDAFSNQFTHTLRDAQAMSFAGNLMDRDHEAIERLKQLGFSDHKAIEAYFVCERNENAAAEYLFSQNFE